jgi:hypothetical protein
MATFPDARASTLHVADSRVAQVFGSRRQDVLDYLYFNVYNPVNGGRKYSLYRDVYMKFPRIQNLELRHLDRKILKMLEEDIDKFPKLTGFAFHEFSKDDEGNEIKIEDFLSTPKLVNQIKVLAVGCFVSGELVERLCSEVFNKSLQTLILISVNKQSIWKEEDCIDLSKVLICKDTLENLYLGNRPFRITDKLKDIRMPNLKVFETLNTSSITEDNIDQMGSVLNYSMPKLDSLILNYGTADPIYDRNTRKPRTFLQHKQWVNLTLIFDSYDLDPEDIEELLSQQNSLKILKFSGKVADELSRIVTLDGLEKLVELTPYLEQVCIFPLGKKSGEFMFEDQNNINRFVNVIKRWKELKEVHLPAPLESESEEGTLGKYRTILRDQLKLNLKKLSKVVFVDDAYTIDDDVLRKHKGNDIFLEAGKDDCRFMHVSIYASHPRHFCRCPFNPLTYGPRTF